MAEGTQTFISNRETHFGDWQVSLSKEATRLLEAAPRKELVWGLPERAGEQALEMKWRQAGPASNIGEYVTLRDACR